MFLIETDLDVDNLVLGPTQHKLFFFIWFFWLDYAIKEQPLLAKDMQGGPDHIYLKMLDTDSICIIGSVLGQSIALDYFVRKDILILKN